MKPTDMITTLASVKDAIARDPVLESCEEVLKAFEFFQDAGINDDQAVHLTAIAINNLWEEL